MSQELFKIAAEFLSMNSDPNIFVDEYIAQWKKERDSGISRFDAPQLSEGLSSIFCLADLFNPDDDRESYELDEVKLRTEIELILKRVRGV